MPFSTARRAIKDLDLVRIFVRALSLLSSDKRSVRLILAASLVIAVTRVSEPVLIGRLIDAFNRLALGPHGRTGAVWTIISVLGAVNVISLLASYFVALRADRLVQRARWDVAQRYLRHVMTMSHAFHQRQGGGALARYMLEANNYLYGMWLQLFREHISGIMAAVILFPVTVYLNPALSILLVMLVISFVIINVYFAVITDVGQRRAYEVDKQISSHFGDTIGNALLIKTYGRVGTAIERHEGFVAKFLAIQFPVLTRWATAYVLTRAFSAAALLIIFVVGTHLFQEGRTTIGELITFVSFAGILITRVEQLTTFGTHLIIYRHIAIKFFEVMDASDVIPERADAIELRDVEGTVRFEDVSFSYDGGDPLIEGMSFEVPAGTTVAIVGSTGAGKTTVIGLLCRFWDPLGGRVLIDGTDIRDVSLRSLHQAISVVFQDSPLLQASLAENLRLGREDVTQEEIDELLDLVALGHLRFGSEGEDQDYAAGQARRAMSGGERQRVGVARALLKDSAILILDEATSALDSVTERKLRLLIERRRSRRTTFIIAHRLTTVRQADVILVLDHGRIVERGSFDELMAAQGWFSKLVAAQAL